MAGFEPAWSGFRGRLMKPGSPTSRSSIGTRGTRTLTMLVKSQVCCLNTWIPRRPNRPFWLQRISSYAAHLLHSPLDHSPLTLLKIVRGGIAPATGDVSDRHASVTTPDQSSP